MNCSNGPVRDPCRCARLPFPLFFVFSGEPLTPLLQHDAPVRQARFIANGRSVLTTTREGVSRMWEVLPDTRSVEELTLIAQLLSGNQNIQAGGVLPQAAESLREHWQNMQARFPLDFSVTPDEIALWQQREANASELWHRREAELCERGQRWFAARFHLDRLLGAHPDDPDLRDRRAAVQARLDVERQ